MTKGKATSVKGFTYEFSSSGNPTVFSVDVKENANVWFRRYNNPAAFDAAEQEFGSAASFAGSDTPTVSPSSGSSDSQTGEFFSVAPKPVGGTAVTAFTTSFNVTGVGWDGDYLWVSNQNGGDIYQFTKSGTQKNVITNLVSSAIQGAAWDGEYLWVPAFNTNTMYQLKTDGTEVSKFSTGLGGTGGVAWDGSYIWSADRTNNSLHQFKTDGTEVSSFSVKAGNPLGPMYDGNYLYVNSDSNTVVYQYKKDGTLVDEGTVSGPPGLRNGAWDGKYHWNGEFSANTVYRIEQSNSLDISYRYFEVT